MQLIFLTLSLIPAILHIVSCYPSNLEFRIQSAMDLCVATSKQNEVFDSQLNEVIIPEDNQEAKDIFGCLSVTLKILNKNGDIDFQKLSMIIQEILKFGMETGDIDNEARYIAESALDHCKKIPRGGGFELTALRMRNCLSEYIMNSDQYF